jgi:hypothetical protein
MMSYLSIYLVTLRGQNPWIPLQYETRGAAAAYSPYAGASYGAAPVQAVAKLGGRHKNKSLTGLCHVTKACLLLDLL